MDTTKNGGEIIKKILKSCLAMLVALLLLLCGCQPTEQAECTKHVDADSNGVCDKCFVTVFVYFDFYAINDLHGKFADTNDNIGVDELTTYLKTAREKDENSIFLSTGDMWQGSSESNLTNGKIITEWMNELDFTAASIGNHEYDWGGEHIKSNSELAEFPLLAINIYDRETKKQVEYCKSSTIVEASGIKIGIIGAIGDCYSSIAVDKCDDVYFLVGKDLTKLVKEEASALKEQGADFIVYMLHDGFEETDLSSTQSVTASEIASYYDVSLSDGYVDLVFEAHTHQGYKLLDEHGVYHLQNRGDNKGGISHAEVAINTATDTSQVRVAELVSVTDYQFLPDDALIQSLLKKYEPQISYANQVLGYNSLRRSGDYMRQLVADLYYEKGMELWGDKYNIVLGGGFTSVRSPYNLAQGNVTYSHLQSLFPFDNNLTLCSVKGRELNSKFFKTKNDDYFICYGDYGREVKENVINNETYYVVVDTYTAYYAPNRLTVVETFEQKLFARDLLARYVQNGGLA
ncbi:MAG: bifunctional metallophosphatase/5'-nucleotidase [Clostridia bacterium]|nr:bifunctional metallophosphatase/5'-nucleotidase [Clostridia bacterium]